jgi:IclR family mhp operon transcriptional activator
MRNEGRFGMQREMDIQSIVRVLSVIETLNQRNVSSVDTIHHVTGLPKPTLVRILATLVGMGYVFHVSRRDGYALTEKVLRLSAGFRYHDAIVDIARPLLEAFTAEHKWQLSIGTLETDAMRVRFNTRHLSPFAPEQLFLNKRVGMLDSALGRAYLAFCSDIERDLILKFAKAADPEHFSAPRHDEALDRLLETIRAKRYATIERRPGNRVRSFAVPVLSADSGAAMGSIALFYFAGVMSEAQATERFLDELYAIGNRIADAVSDLHAHSAEAHAGSASSTPDAPQVANVAPLRR